MIEPAPRRPLARRITGRIGRAVRRIGRRAGAGVVRTVARLPFGLRGLGVIAESMMERSVVVEHGRVRMRFAEPNWLAHYRHQTFATKEPDTLTWIEQMPEGSVLWDVGANVGLYTIYAATARRCHVVAFEPSAFNLELLARNVALNHVAHLVTIAPIALSDRAGPSTFRMSTTAWGGASSTFGHDFDQDGRPFRASFSYTTVGLRMADVAATLALPRPDYLKIDVDGIEHLILREAGAALLSVRGLLVEVNERFAAQARDAERVLEAAGLVRVHASPLGVPWLRNEQWARLDAPRHGATLARP